MATQAYLTGVLMLLGKWGKSARKTTDMRGSGFEAVSGGEGRRIHAAPCSPMYILHETVCGDLMPLTSHSGFIL